MAYQNYIPNREQRTKNLERVNLLTYSIECLREANRAFNRQISTDKLNYDTFIKYLIENQFILMDSIGTMRSFDTAFLLQDIKLDNKHLKHYFLHILEGNKQ